jgi:hypothetical protein
MLRNFVVSVVCLAACSGGGGGGGGDGGPSFGSDHPRIYLSANKDRLAAALAANTPEAKRFHDMVDRWVGGEDVYGFERWNAALVGQLTGDPSYCAAAVKSIDMDVTTAQAAIAAGNAPAIADDDYLGVGDEVGDLSLVYDWCYDTLTSDQRTAWLGFANQAVTNVWTPDSAMWGSVSGKWDGWAIDDPDDNYYYSFLRATMMLGLAAHGEYDGVDQWLTQFHDTKLVGELVPNFNMNLVGGGSREGTGYGVSLRSLFELYDIWSASTTETIATMTPHTRASMLMFIHEILPTLDRVAPTGDQSRDSTASFFDYHRMFLQELVHIFPTDELAPRVLALLQACSVPQMTEEFMYAYDFMLASDTTPTMLDGLGTTYYAPGTGQFYSRSGWDTHATWINMNAGPYTESHAHQDQGALMIYKDGWLAYDPVIDSHSGLPQNVDEHGTIRIVTGGSPVAQKNGSSTLLALHAGTGYVHIATDLTPVENGAATQLQRELVYLPPDTVVIYDRATSPAANQQVWSLAFPAAPTLATGSATVMASGHTLLVQRLGPAAATATVYDYTQNSDFSNGFRLDETMAGGNNRWLHVTSIDGSVTSATSTDGNTVNLVLAGGATASVAFNPNSVGATLTLGSQTITLGAGIDSLPE